jgi:iron complex outermembrane receptor protein
VSGSQGNTSVGRRSRLLSKGALAGLALCAAPVGVLGLASPALAQGVLPPLQVESRKAPAKQPRTKKQSAAPKSDAAQGPAPQAKGPEKSTGHVDGYIATVSGTGSKTDTPLLLTPQSISVVPADQIKDQGAQSIVEALRYTPGVTVEMNNNTRFDELRVRGFLPVQYLDGMPVPYNQFFGTPRIEPYGLERIEVLKGPASFLFGQNSPGGLVNMISKRPTEEAQNELQLQFGSFNRLQAAFDLSGPASKDGQVLYRLTGVMRDAETVVDYTRDDVFYIAPAFTWRPSADTSLTVLASYGYDKGTFPHQYLPAEGTLLPNPNGKIPLHRFLGEPGWDRFDREQWAVGYAFEHRLNEAWKFRQNLRYASVDTYFQAHRVEGFADADLTTVDRGAYAVSADAGTFTVDNQLETKFASGPLGHKVLVGFDYLRTTGNFAFNGASPVKFPGGTYDSPINVYNPVYGAVAVPPLLPFQANHTEQTQVGVYVQDQIKLGNWLLTLGGRQDWAENAVDDLLSGKTPRQDDAAFTGRAGLTYAFANGLAPYVSYATSFQPVVGAVVGAGDQLFKPTTGEQYEAGIKYQPGANLLITAAVFDIVQQNYLSFDPVTFTGSQIGEVHVRGFDIEARAKLTRNLDVIAAYAYLDHEVTASANSAEVGTAIPMVAQHQASAWAKYTFSEGTALSGLWIGAGVRYTGSALGGTVDDPLDIPAYTLVDAGMVYDLGRLDKSFKGAELGLNVTNLFDDYHVAGYCDRTYCSLGAGRTVLTTLRYRW